MRLAQKRCVWSDSTSSERSINSCGRMSSFESCSAQKSEHSDYVILRNKQGNRHMTRAGTVQQLSRMMLQILREVVVAPLVRSGLSAATDKSSAPSASSSSSSFSQVCDQLLAFGAESCSEPFSAHGLGWLCSEVYRPCGTGAGRPCDRDR